MTIYAEVTYNEELSYDEEDFTPSVWEYAGASAKQAWIDSPLSSLSRMKELDDALGKAPVINNNSFTGGFNWHTMEMPKQAEIQKMNLALQQKRIDEAGLQGRLKAEDGYTSKALEIIIERKKAEIKRQEILSADVPLHYDVLGFGASFGASMLDPINIGSAFIPVLGQARLMNMMGTAARTGSKLAMAGTRAKIGAIEGLAGAALLEPLTYFAHDQEQADYDTMDSLLNVGFGAVFGATIQPSFGAVGDAIRKKRGNRAEWESISPSRESEALHLQFIEDAHTGYLEANPNADKQWSVVAGSLFDARARAWAYDMGAGEEGVIEYYKKNAPQKIIGVADGVGQSLESKLNFQTLNQSQKYTNQIGEVNEEIATRLNIKQGGIRLLDENLQHIIDRHSKEIKTAGFDNPRDFVKYVLDNASVIYNVDEYKRKFDIIADLGKNNGRVMIRLEMDTDSDFYSIPTAGVMRKDFFKKKTPLWERAQTNPTKKSSSAYLEQNDAVGNITISNNNVKGGDTLFQSTREEINIAEQSLANDVRAWGESVGAFVGGTLPPRKPITMLNQTPLVLQMLGAKSLPVETTYSMLKKVIVDKHGLSPDIIKQIPQAIADPIMVFKSASSGGDIVMMLDVKDSDGASIIVPISLNQTSLGRYSINEVKSIYGKKNIDTNNINNAWFLRQIEEGNLLYRNNKKSRDWARAEGLQLPPRTNRHDKNRIRTDADLVKLRENNPTLYQFIGEQGAGKLDRAKEVTLRLDNLSVAREMEAANKNDSLIKLATGWERGADGKWRYEIGDGEITDLSNIEKYLKEYPYETAIEKLSSFYKNPELHKAYSRLAGFVAIKDLEGAFGQVEKISPDSCLLYLGKQLFKETGSFFDVKALGVTSKDKVLSALVHEMQHVIQAREGFAKGGNPRQFEGIKAKPGKTIFGNEMLSPYEQYRRLAGEVEARNVQTRLKMSPKERRMTLARETEDVAREDQIFLYESLKSQQISQSARASTTFNEEGADGRAVIRFFSSADASSLPHELYHVFRREMEQTIQDPRANDRIKQNYALIEEFVGAKRGEKWTVEQEEKFAKAAERYLLEGKAPTKELEGIFAKLKQWFMEIYTSLDLANFPISNEMRKVFGDILSPNYEESDLMMRNAIGRLVSYDPLEDMDTETGEVFDKDSNEWEAINQSFESTEIDFMQSVRNLAMSEQDIVGDFEGRYREELGEIDKEISKLDTENIDT